MKPLYLGLIALLVIGGVFFWKYSVKEPEPLLAPADQLTVPAEGSAMLKTIPLVEQSALGQSGLATITENADGMAVVSLKMSGPVFPAPQPAHIHVGSCPSPGAVKYPLTNVVNGMSETTLSVRYSDLIAATEKMAINVHKSAAEASVYTACGDMN